MAEEGSDRKAEAQSQLAEAMSHRAHIDNSIKLIGKLLFGIEKSHEIMNAIQPTGKPLVEDWSCIKSMVTHNIKSTHLPKHTLHTSSFPHLIQNNNKNFLSAKTG